MHSFERKVILATLSLKVCSRHLKFFFRTQTFPIYPFYLIHFSFFVCFQFVVLGTVNCHSLYRCGVLFQGHGIFFLARSFWEFITSSLCHTVWGKQSLVADKNQLCLPPSPGWTFPTLVIIDTFSTISGLKPFSAFIMDFFNLLCTCKQEIFFQGSGLAYFVAVLKDLKNSSIFSKCRYFRNTTVRLSARLN